MPNAKGGATTVLDLGANVDCTRASAAVCRHGLGPGVALEERGGGRRPAQYRRRSHQGQRSHQARRRAAARGRRGRPELLRQREGNDIFKGTVDIVVCDGLSATCAQDHRRRGLDDLGGFKEEFKRNIFTKLRPSWPIRCYLR
jgi:glycerol-3-phosphate acyltransferase PlsX